MAKRRMSHKLRRRTTKWGRNKDGSARKKPITPEELDRLSTEAWADERDKQGFDYLSHASGALMNGECTRALKALILATQHASAKAEAGDRSYPTSDDVVEAWNAYNVQCVRAKGRSLSEVQRFTSPRRRRPARVR